ncbi:MAG: acetyl-CoA hydrolase/transferase family protein [Deltaproteobacteria bacterium]|nr:MAG: acetyl-CoA hydrolase/transferase family protein [Deltaproteobacteria bacterium]
MSIYADEYRRKLTTPEQAAVRIGQGATLVHGMAVGEPPALLAAIAQRVRVGDLEDLKVFSLLPMQHAARTILAPHLLDKIHPFCWFLTAYDRDLVKKGLNYFVPNEFHQLPRIIRDFMEIDVTVTCVSSMDNAGFFSFGVVNDYISTAARHCKQLIVEVNPRMPRVFGEALLHVSEVDAIVENDAPLIEAVPAKPKHEAEAIGRLIAEMIPDGATIQLGIGGIPNAVCEHLENHKDLGIHTELMCPGMVRLIKKGAVTGKKKTLHPLKHVFTNAIGDREMYEFMHDNPSMESYPVSYTNAPEVIAKNDRMISINSTIEVDLLGQCNSEYLGGSEFSGTGGQLDYVRGAFNAREGKSIIAFYATAHSGEVSRVVPRFQAGTVVTTPRMDTHYLATEYGVVNLKGKSTRDRALDIISLAHPRFRDDLLKEAQGLRLL